MRICIMAALIMIGARLEMPWYYWLVIMTDISVLIAKGIYSAKDKWDT